MNIGANVPGHRSDADDLGHADSPATRAVRVDGIRSREVQRSARPSLRIWWEPERSNVRLSGR